MVYELAMRRRMAAFGVVLAAACCSKSEVKDGGSGSALGKPPVAFTLFALAEVRGQIGPCGCTSDPLGDISRTAQLVAEARAKGPVLVIDAGGLLYSQNPVPPHLEAEEELKANLLASLYKEPLQVAALGVGASDLAKGESAVRLPRELVNPPAASKLPIEAPKVVQVGDAKVGVFGVIAEDSFGHFAVTAPVDAAKLAITGLRGRGADVIVALVQAGSKKDAVALIRQIGGIDVAIAGLGLDAPEPENVEIEPSKVGDGWLVIPGNRGQVLSRIDISLRRDGTHPVLPLVDAGGAGAATAKIAAIDKRLAALDIELAKFATDKTADPTFVATKQAERTDLAAQRADLVAHPLKAPPRGSYLTLDQIRINKALACSAPVQEAVRAYDRDAGAANVKAAADKPVPEPAKGQATYVGMAACGDCHSDEVEFWKKTVHTQAWQTLVDRGQQFDYECIGCHVTGFDKPGGSNLAHNDNLRDIQCETCHGPASIHVAKGGEEKPPAVKRSPSPDLCATQCHTHEHSDTFQYEAYLRDIVGTGHGDERRKQLGDGPTGHELRKAALDKAGKAIGAGCIR